MCPCFHNLALRAITQSHTREYLRVAVPVVLMRISRRPQAPWAHLMLHCPLLSRRPHRLEMTGAYGRRPGIVKGGSAATAAAGSAGRRTHAPHSAVSPPSCRHPLPV